MTTSFGELRSLLQQPPTAALWIELVGLLESMDEGLRQAEALPYTLAHVSRWPKGLREAPAWARNELFLAPDDPKKHAPYHWLWSLIDAVSFTFHTQVDDARVSALAKDERLAQLETLGFEQPNFTALGASALAQSPYLGRLRQLHINKIYGDVQACASLFDAPWFGELDEVVLSATGLEPAQLAQLWARLDQPPRWRSLDLSANHRLVTDGFSAVSAHEPWPSLEQLSLSRCYGFAGGAQRDAAAGFQWSSFPALKRLDLSSLSNANALLEAAWSQGLNAQPLEELVLDDVRLSARAWQRFGKTLAPGALKRLSLCAVESSADLLELIATEEACAGLRQLSLKGWSAPLYNAAFSALFKPGALPDLESLDLSYCKLDEPGIQGLIQMTHWTSLRQLKLQGCANNRALVTTLLNALPFDDLQSIDLGGCAVTDDDLDVVLSWACAGRLEALTLWPCRLSVPGLWRLTQASELSIQARAWIRGQLLSRLSAQGVEQLAAKLTPTLKARSKRALVAALTEALEPRERLAQALCAAEFLDVLSQPELAATAAALGLKRQHRAPVTALRSMLKKHAQSLEALLLT